MAASDQVLDQAPRLRLAGFLSDLAGEWPPIQFRTLRHGLGLLRLNFPQLLQHGDASVELRLNGTPIGPAAFDQVLDAGDVVEIVPMVAGSNRGVGKIVLAAVLIATSFHVPASWAAAAAIKSTMISVGLNLALSGVQLMLTSDQPTPEEQEQRGGGQYSGPRTATGEGQAMPLHYGYSRISGVVIQRAIDTVQLEGSAASSSPLSSGGQPIGAGGA